MRKIDQAHSSFRLQKTHVYMNRSLAKSVNSSFWIF